MLVEKYGQPPVVAEEKGILLLAWQEDIEDATNHVTCQSHLLELGYIDWPSDNRPWLGPAGSVAFPTEQANGPGSLAASSFLIENFVGRSGQSQALCPESLIALIVTGTDGRALRMLTAIADPETLSWVVDKNRQESTEKSESELGTEIDIKL